MKDEQLFIILIILILTLIVSLYLLYKTRNVPEADNDGLFEELRKGADHCAEHGGYGSKSDCKVCNAKIKIIEGVLK